jgi:hypothetical protein
MILGVCFSVALGLVLSLYLRITLKDVYFPYWDPYLTKIISSGLGSIDVFQFVSDPLFYYSVRGIHDVSFLSYYDIIRYGNLFFIAFLFLVLYLFFEESVTPRETSNSVFIIAAVSYYFVCSYSYKRFSMTVREDLIITVGFVIFLMLSRFDRENVMTTKRAAFLAILFAFVIASHILVAAVVLGTLFLYTVYCVARGRKNILRGLAVMALISGILSSPFIYAQYAGIAAQLTRGIEFIEAQGFDLSYNLIKLSNFNVPMDLIVLAGGTLVFLWFVLRSQVDFKRLRIILLYFTTVVAGIVLCYVPQFGMKQDRFLIYAYVALSFLFVYALKGLYRSQYGKAAIPIVVLVTFAIAVPAAMNYQGYFPINENNVAFLHSSLSELDAYGKIYAGGTALVILSYLDSSSELVSFRDNLEHIPDRLDGPVVMASDDISAFRARDPLAFERFEELKELNFAAYDGKSGTWIIFPERTSGWPS